MADQARLYFSFRSPYSWLLQHRIARLGEARLPMALDWVPVFPPPGSPLAEASGDSPKVRWIGRETREQARAMGLVPAPQWSGDGDWARPHSAWLWCREQGQGTAALAAFFAARFQDGLDLCDAVVLEGLGTALGLDGKRLVAAGDDPAWRQRQMQGMRAMLEDGAFGVPTVVWGDRLWWGNDRFEWFLRSAAEARGDAVPDLAAEPFGPAWRP